MFQVHSGPFHPHLEDAFAATVARLKTAPFSPLAVVAPSARLRDRTQAILAERGMAALNIHFHTIASLADAVVESVGGFPAPLSDPLFFDTLVRRILREDRPFEGFADLAVPDGFPPSVRSTLRDLIDAGVKPEIFREAVDEHDEYDIPEVDAGSLKQLIHLQSLYLRRLSSLAVAPRSRVLEAAAEAAPASTFLRRFDSILFYGFYDLTGLQKELFESVVRNHPSHLFFPYLHGHPDHAFGARFRGDVLDKIPNDETLLAQAEAPHVTFRGTGRLERSSSGLPRVVRWDARGALPPAEARVVNVSGVRDEAWSVAAEILLLHDAGTPFSEIAVVARTRERLAQIGAVFEERRIPYVTSWKRTIGDRPQVEIGLGLLSFAAGVSSDRAFLRSPEMAVSHGVEPWPAESSWTDAVERAAALLDAFVKPSGPESALTWIELRKALLTLREFDRMQGQVSRTDFIDTVRQRWKDWPWRSDERGAGVAVLHAEAARGLPFDTVFLAGLEEKVFPRAIREDPFLRDKTRGAIVKTIGNRIGQKLLALDEERLLLNLILNSARRRVYLLYQRSDDEGRIVGPSSFLRRLIDEWGIPFDDAVNVVPRRLGGKVASTAPEAMGVRDLMSGLLMDGRATDAALLAASVGRDGTSLLRSIEALNALESWEGPGRYDGIVGSVVGTAHLDRDGMSPSGLESFARCPFQYFVKRVLRLAPPDEDPTPDRMPDDVRGKLVHGFLERFYRRCSETFGDRWPATPPEKLFDEAFDAHVMEPPSGLYPVLWNAVRRNLRDSIFRLLSADFATLVERALVPSYFEHRVSSSTLEPAFGGVRFDGIMDRIDVGNGRARVVDYKTGARSRTRMTTSAVRGEKAQPSIYILMAAEYLRLSGKAVTDVDFAYLHLGEEEPVQELSSAAWAANRSDIVDTVRSYLDLIRDGRFPFLPGRHCDWCDAAPVCRRTDSISAFRTAPAADAVLAVRRKKAKGDA